MTSSPGSVISVDQLQKHYQVPVRQAGLKASVTSLVHRTYNTVRAVDGVSFNIAPGEVVGFLGPNGAGKTTTLKMLSGLLHPSGGQARVLGFEPARRQAEFLRQITLVMGNRNQLNWDLPAMDSYEQQRAIYGLPRPQYEQARDELVELLALDGLLTKPVRNLSLGERMKVEIAGALLHRPAVLFLDEPTIGLDVTMQRRIRQFVADYNRRNGAAVLLTSHYMADVEALCKRVIVIHHGQLLFDGALSELVERFSAYKTLQITLAEAAAGLDAEALAARLAGCGELLEQDGAQLKLRVRKSETPQVTARLLAELPVEDLTVENPPIESVIEDAFQSAAPQAG